MWWPGRSRADSDADLVARAQRGDGGAFAELVQRWRDPIYGLCLRWLGDPGQADEVTQEVFVSAWKAIRDFRGDARWSTWLHRVAVNHCKNAKGFQRRRRMDDHDSLDAPEDPDRPRRELADPGRGTEGPTEVHEAGRVVADALARLDEEHRAVILLRDLQDLDYDEIATLLSIPRGTVKSRLHRARLALADALAATGAGGPPWA